MKIVPKHLIKTCKRKCVWKTSEHKAKYKTDLLYKQTGWDVVMILAVTWSVANSMGMYGTFWTHTKNKIPCIFKNLKLHGNQITALKCTLYYYSWATKWKEILFKVFFFTLRRSIQEKLYRCCHNSVIFQQQGGSVLILNAHRLYLPFNIFFWALCFLFEKWNNIYWTLLFTTDLKICRTSGNIYIMKINCCPGRGR